MPNKLTDTEIKRLWSVAVKMKSFALNVLIKSCVL